MGVIVDQPLAASFIPNNTRQQRASLPFKLGVLERKVYNNDDKTFFSVLTFTKPSCDNVLQPSLLCGSGCNTLSHSALANINNKKRVFYPLSITPKMNYFIRNLFPISSLRIELNVCF